MEAIRLQHCNEHIYMNHRKFFSPSYLFRSKRKTFNEKEEMTKMTTPAFAWEVYEQVKDIQNDFSKPYKSNHASGFKKRSIF